VSFLLYRSTERDDKSLSFLSRKFTHQSFGSAFAVLFQRSPCRFHSGTAEETKSTIDRGEVAKFSAIGKGWHHHDFLYLPQTTTDQFRTTDRMVGSKWRNETTAFVQSTQDQLSEFNGGTTF
jgi:hypothetical protein